VLSSFLLVCALLLATALSAAEAAAKAGTQAEPEAQREMLGWWPEDLVLVPIPGRTPEFGWSIAVMGGYFLDLDKPNPDTPNSIVGGFGWYSENKSWAAGAAGKFNLVDDRIRINLAAGYLDVNYNFYGVGNDAGDQGTSVRVEQEAPL
jgi:opacity protein-like surface antigen